MAYSELFKLLPALALTIGLFVAMVLLLRKLQPGGTGGALINVLAARSLGGKEKIWLLAVGEQQLLVGSSPGKVVCLHVLDKPLDVPVTPTAAPLFANVLQQFQKGAGQ